MSAATHATNLAANLTILGQALAALRANALCVAAFCSQARGQDALLAALPPRFGEVWLGLLDRLESSALFSEESCSFSQSALLDNLDMWLQKAGEKLAH
jgi:hypothetical protein